MNVLAEISLSILKGDSNLVLTLTQKAIEQGIMANEILATGLIGGMELVGNSWKKGELFIPEVLISAKAMHSGLVVIKPILAKGFDRPKGRIIIGTVKGDLHDIGKKIVAMMLEGNGFEVYDLGVNVEAGQFLEAALEKEADIVCLSALLTTTMPAMEETVLAINTKTGNTVKTMVGGAPVTAEFANKINASGYAPDAIGAVDLAKRRAMDQRV